MTSISEMKSSGGVRISIEIAIIYVVAGALWILFSDKLVGVIFHDRELIIEISMIKGWGFVLITAFMLYGLIERWTSKLRESEAKFRSYIEHAPLAVFVSDGEGRLVDCNPSALKLFDYDASDLAGRTILDLHPDEDREEVLRTFSVLFQEGHAEGEFRLKRRDGFPIWCSLNAVLVTEQLALGYLLDITEKKRDEMERELTIEFLRLVQEAENKQEMIAAAVAFFKERSGCEAVGIRLKEGDDYPYFETRGFPPGFVQTESSLCARGGAGEIQRDNLGNAVLACMCGNVIRGRFDPLKPFFTENGSFWTESTSQLLTETTEADRQARTRNRCHGEGYESVALIPLDAGAKGLGLLQINDRRKGCFTAEDIGLWERLAGYLAVALAKFDSEEKLRESEEEFQTMFEAASIGMSQADLVTGRLLRVNRKMCEITGYTTAELLTMGFMDITHPEDRQRNWAAFKDRAKNATKDYRLEKRYIRKNGQTIWVSVNSTVIRDSKGQPRRTFAAIEDISERKRAEELLSRQEMMLRETAEIAHVGGWEFDPISLEGSWTEQTARIHDVDPKVNPNVTFGMNFYIGESRGRIETAVREAIELAKPYNLELEMVSAKGVHKWVRSICHPVVSDGRVVKMRGSIQDITERRQAEEALRKSLDEKVALLKEVHHRVKNNLQIVSSLLGLQMGRSEDRKVLDVLKDTRSRVRSMALLHETLYRSGNLARVNFAAYLRDLCGQLLASSGPVAGRVRMEYRVAQIVLSLEQALPCGLIVNELVLNALKHAFPGTHTGKIIVEFTRAEGSKLVLSVRDEGVGLPADFDLSGTSTLGVQLVSGLTGQLSGRLEVEGGHGTGAALRVVFPVPKDTLFEGES